MDSKEHETGKGIVGLGILVGVILLWLGKTGLPSVLVPGKVIFGCFTVMFFLILLGGRRS
jgi:hypothetical protein